MVSNGLIGVAMKRRSLVLTDEAARHWFRASLPPHIRASARAEQAHASTAPPPHERHDPSARTSELLSAALVFCATFCAVLLFIA